VATTIRAVGAAADALLERVPGADRNRGGVSEPGIGHAGCSGPARHVQRPTVPLPLSSSWPGLLALTWSFIASIAQLAARAIGRISTGCGPRNPAGPGPVYLSRMRRTCTRDTRGHCPAGWMRCAGCSTCRRTGLAFPVMPKQRVASPSIPAVQVTRGRAFAGPWLAPVFESTPETSNWRGSGTGSCVYHSCSSPRESLSGNA